MKKILYVVHRYAPYPGGSENYVQAMAEETASRNNIVAVFTGEHKGNYNGIRVSNNPNILLESWDLIVVHGGDVGLQNFVLSNAKNIKSPILYLIVLPSESSICLQALKDCKYLGWSTEADLRHLEKFNVKTKGVQVRHGIKLLDSIGSAGFKQKYNLDINKKMFLSCGGYWPNKAMKELSTIFNDLKIDDSFLVLTGYDNRNNLMPSETNYVKPFLIEDKKEVMSAILESDVYILHSYTEGFGLVLLESMINKTPWAARNIAGAESMQEYGFTYSSDDQLINYIKTYKKPSLEEMVKRQNYVLENRLIINTVNDILIILQ